MSLIDQVKEAGIVGEGGAGFPTHVKLDTKVEYFIINAAECEPLIETDKFICRTFALEMIQGAIAVAKHVGAKKIIIGLKAKYKDEITCLEDAIAKVVTPIPIEIFKMRTFYPAGDEQVMIQQILDRIVPERGLPSNVETVVANVGTVVDIKRAIEGIPVTEKYLSVTGEVEKPIMLKVPIGTSIRQCIAWANPKLNDYAIIVGGPMMGKVLAKEEEIDAAVVTKTVGNILVLPKKHYLIRWNDVGIERIRLQTRSACIQCRMCTDLCPRYLIGHQIRPHHVMRNMFREFQIDQKSDYAKAFGDALNCCECGICEMFACPMGLSPKRVNMYFKKELRKKEITIERNMHPQKLSAVDNHKVPTKRLIARLGLSKYAEEHAQVCLEKKPDNVFIPLQMHIGKPAIAIVAVGDDVTKGMLLAKADEQGLSVNIHASMDGRVALINSTGIQIRKKEG